MLPLGSTEQHAYLSLATDSILAERCAVEAAEPLGVAVLPVLAYGVTPAFAAYPCSPSLTRETYIAALRELVGSLRSQGFRRILVVNGHGGNAFAAEHVDVAWHDWWRAPRTAAVQRSIEPAEAGRHAAWIENFPWTRLAGVVVPAEPKPDAPPLPADPAAVRALLGDGSFGGPYAVGDDDVLRLWAAAVAETRERIESL